MMVVMVMVVMMVVIYLWLGRNFSGSGLNDGMLALDFALGVVDQVERMPQDRKQNMKTLLFDETESF